jgi:hypothetical protein
MKTVLTILFQALFSWLLIVLGNFSRCPVPMPHRAYESILMGTFIWLGILLVIGAVWVIALPLLCRFRWNTCRLVTWGFAALACLMYELDARHYLHVRRDHWLSELTGGMECSVVKEFALRRSLQDPDTELVVLRMCSQDLSRMLSRMEEAEVGDLGFRHLLFVSFNRRIPESTDVRYYRVRGSSKGIFAVVGSGEEVVFVNAW